MGQPRLRNASASPTPLDEVFARVRHRLDEHGVDMPLDALYLEEHFTGVRRDRICIAPHGGGIEPWTRFLARKIYDRVQCDYWSAWADFYPLLDRGLEMRWVDRTCKMLHVTSHAIWERPVLYRELSTLLGARTQPYPFAVALHGKADDAENDYCVEVGGTSEWRHVLREKLDAHGIAARDGSGKRAGRNPTNIVNLLGAESVQIEIPRSYRRHPVFGYAIGQAVAETLEEFEPSS